jgi:Cu/Ag efflux protein CusF
MLIPKMARSPANRPRLIPTAEDEMLPGVVKIVAASLFLIATTYMAAAERVFGSQNETSTTNLGRSVAQSESPGLPATFEGVGIITGIEPESESLTVDHEEIKGFMEAMEMSYHVTQPTLLKGLKVGDKISFTIDPASYSILDLRVVEHVN